MAKKIMWAGSYGPDRSHDTLDTNVFDRKKDALTFAKRGTHWRVTRLEWADEWSKPKREDVEIGGPDIDKQIESVRMAEQARTMKRVSTGRALTLWRQQMRARHGSGGTMNPKKRKKKKAKRMVKRTNPGPRKKRRSPNPTSLAKTILSKVVQPGASFSLTKLKTALRKVGYRNVGGWIDEMIKDATKRRLISAVSKTVFVFTPAAANPYLMKARKKRKK